MNSKIACILLALGAPLANGATYIVGNVAGNNSSPVVSVSGIRLTGNGSSGAFGGASFGYSSNTTSIVAGDTGTVQEFLSGWTAFGAGTGSFNNPTVPTNYEGLFSIQGTVNGAALDAFTGRNIHVILYNAATLAASTEVMVIRLDATFGAGANEPINATFTLDTSNTNYTVLWGTKGGPSMTAGGIDTVPEASFQLAPVPEASSALLGLLGAVGLLRRRR